VVWDAVGKVVLAAILLFFWRVPAAGEDASNDAFLGNGGKRRVWSEPGEVSLLAQGVDGFTD